MTYRLEFPSLLTYDPAQTGISLMVGLTLGEMAVEVPVKLDTGATNCIFAREIGERLGLDIETGSPLKFATATGTFLAYGHYLTLTVLDYQFETELFFAAHYSFPRNVLGRKGFLDHFLIAISDYEGKLFIDPFFMA